MHQIPKLKCSSSRLAVVTPQSIEVRCSVENEDVVGAAPTGDAPTTSEWSTILLPTMVQLILEVWQQVWNSSVLYPIVGEQDILFRQDTSHDSIVYYVLFHGAWFWLAQIRNRKLYLRRTYDITVTLYVYHDISNHRQHACFFLQLVQANINKSITKPLPEPVLTVRSSDTHLRTISQDISVTKISLKITDLGFHLNLPGANDLTELGCYCNRPKQIDPYGTFQSPFNISCRPIKFCNDLVQQNPEHVVQQWGSWNKFWTHKRINFELTKESFWTHKRIGVICPICCNL